MANNYADLVFFSAFSTAERRILSMVSLRNLSQSVFILPIGTLLGL